MAVNHTRAGKSVRGVALVRALGERDEGSEAKFKTSSSFKTANFTFKVNC